jgi:DNA repair exonuclease SbcCD nuclease subunit
MGSLPAGKGAYAPFAAEAATPNGLRYLALGHFHGAKRIQVHADTWVQYCGSPVGHDFGETGTHVYVEIEIDDADLHVREVPSSDTVFSVHTLDCSDMESSQQIIEAIRDLIPDAAGSRIARVVLQGAVSQELRMELQAVHDAVRGDFEYLELVDRLDTEMDFESLASEQTSLGAFVSEINAQLRDTTEERRRAMLVRARELGVAAYRGRMAPVRGAGGE